MSLLNLITSGPGFEQAAMGMLKSHMLKEGIHMFSIGLKPGVSADTASLEDFEIKFFKQPAATISIADLQLYQEAVTKCLSNGI